MIVDYCRHLSKPIVFNVIQYSVIPKESTRLPMPFNVFQIISKTHPADILVRYCAYSDWLQGFKYLLRYPRILSYISKHQDDVMCVLRGRHKCNILRYISDKSHEPHEPYIPHMPHILDVKSLLTIPLLARSGQSGIRGIILCYAYAIRQLDASRNVPGNIRRMLSRANEMVMYHVMCKMRNKKRMNTVLRQINADSTDIVTAMQIYIGYMPIANIRYFIDNYKCCADLVTAGYCLVNAIRAGIFDYIVNRKDFPMISFTSDRHREWMPYLMEFGRMSDVVSLLSRAAAYGKPVYTNVVTLMFVIAIQSKRPKVYNYIYHHKSHRKYIDYGYIDRMYENRTNKEANNRPKPITGGIPARLVAKRFSSINYWW